MAEHLFAGLTYEQAVRKYTQTVGSVCVMRLQNWADAEDCFQNVFLKLYDKAPTFRDEEHLKAWLIRVAINECRNYIRQNRRTVPLEEAERQTVTFSETSGDLSWALMKTPKKYRDALYLYYCENYKVAEIAQILGIRENSGKTLLYQRRKILESVDGGDGSN